MFTVVVAVAVNLSAAQAGAAAASHVGLPAGVGDSASGGRGGVQQMADPNRTVYESVRFDTGARVLVQIEDDQVKVVRQNARRFVTEGSVPAGLAEIDGSGGLRADDRPARGPPSRALSAISSLVRRSIGLLTKPFGAGNLAL
jgi:hypothetical protein